MVGDGDFPKKSRKVPPANSTRNFFQEEVVGNKTDTAVTTAGTDKTLVAYTKGALNQLSSIITLLGQVIDVQQNVVSWSDVNRSVRFEISLIDKDSGGIPSGNITAGTYVIDRNRHGNISAFADAGGGNVTVTSATHGLSNGDEVIITGTTNYDGTYTISGVAPNIFVITATWVATETGLWNAWQEIVSSTAFSKATGLVYTDYFFNEDDWATDDIFRATPSGISVVIGGNTYYPAVTSWLGTIQDTSTIEGKIDTIDGKVDAIQTDIDEIPSEANTKTFNTTALASINAEVDTALDTAIPATPTADSINDVLKTNLDAKVSEVKEQICDTADPAGSISKLLKDNLNEPVGDVKDSLGGIDSTTTDSVHGKLGTDTEMADRSVFDLLQAGLATVAFIPLDYREVDITNVAGDVTLASRTPAASELINSKDGTGGEIDKVELWLMLSALDTSGAQNNLDCSTATHNQLQINIAAGGAVDLPAGMHGGITGQFADEDLYCATAYSTGGIQLMADVSKLGATNLEDNIIQAIVVTLQNARSIGNMRLRATTFLRVLYNGKCKV